MHNKDKSEYRFAVTSYKRVAIFQASLKLVREEMAAQLSNKNSKHLTSLGLKYLHEGAINLELIR